MSLKASELRIGNKVFRGGLFGEPQIEVTTIASEIYELSVCENSAHDFAPIPLTEEIAKKFNFEADHTRKRVYKSPETGIEIFFDSISEVSVYLGDYYIKTVKYAHDLQNIVFALSGEELKYEG